MLLNLNQLRIPLINLLGEGWRREEDNLGKVGKISNFGAIGDGRVKGNLGKAGKIGNFGAVGDGRVKGNLGKAGVKC